MKPLSLSFKNVKGTDGSFALTGVNVFSGPNGSGKSAALSAIKVGLWGYDLELGKQHKATIQLAADNRPTMEISQVWGERSFTREWKRKIDPNTGEVEVKYSQTGEPFEDLPAILMDMDEFLGPKKTEQDRINYVFARIAESDLGFSDDELVAALEKLEAVPVKPAEAARTKLVAEVKKSIEVRKRDKMKIQDWLDKLLATVKDQAKEAGQNLKTTGQSMQPLKANGPVPKDQSAVIGVKSSELILLESAKNGLEAIKTQHESNVKRIAAIQADLAKPVEDNSPLEQEHEKLRVETLAYKSQTAALREKIAGKREKAKGIKTAKETANAEATQLEAFIEANKCSDPNCPYTKREQAKLSSLRTAAGKEAKAYSAIVEEGEALKKDLAASEKADAEQQKKVTRLSELKDTLERKSHLTEGARGQLASELGKLQALTYDPKPFADATARYDTAKTELDALRAEQSKFDSFAGSQKTLQTLEQNVLGYTAEKAILDLARDVIEKIQQKILEHAFQPLLTKAAPFIDGLLTEATNGLEYRKGSIGMTTTAGWVPIKLFSDSQKALAFAGLAVALAQQSPLKVVFMDEMGKFQHSPVNRKELVINRMCELVQNGTIHAFFGADNRTEDYTALTDSEFSLHILS